MKTYVKLILLLAIPLLLLIVWAFLSEDFSGGTLPARADFSALLPDTEARMADSLTTAEPQEKQVDTTAQRILFFGDSMVEGLMGRIAQRATAGSHDITSVVWYSSGTRQWADTDTLQHFINEVQPTYVLVCLGANQLFVRNLHEVDKEIERIVERLGGTPFVWISPPNWKDDTGINELIIKHVGPDRYFDSRHLSLARRNDHAHPTAAAAREWADTVCNWLSTTQPRHPISLPQPSQAAKGNRQNAKTVLLQPMQ
ncbi:MAG: SGNH/GDSL hydrolase family protein [Bacteroidaceae bacterium]|nr:SGNH/GDSL hydrolase family protein [Bacteroidaceae bacterium]